MSPQEQIALLRNALKPFALLPDSEVRQADIDEALRVLELTNYDAKPNPLIEAHQLREHYKEHWNPAWAINADGVFVADMSRATNGKQFVYGPFGEVIPNDEIEPVLDKVDGGSYVGSWVATIQVFGHPISIQLLNDEPPKKEIPTHEPSNE